MAVRRHVITGEPVLFAPERAARPHAFSGDASALERCPFCPGHESDTPPEIARLGSDGWIARVFPNKYPPVPGAEVIVESPDHEARFASLEHAEAILRLYLDRLRAHTDAAYAALFTNDGVAAGSSIAHLHSQLVPLPFVPVRIARELEAFAKHCALCGDLENVIRETDRFRWIAPSGSWMPYQQWLVPKRHVPDMTTFDDNELAELATLLRETSAATARVADASNRVFMNFPRAASAHAYIEILPRLTTIAGLELGTGTFVEIVDPARAAETLRP